MTPTKGASLQYRVSFKPAIISVKQLKFEASNEKIA